MVHHGCACVRSTAAVGKWVCVEMGDWGRGVEEKGDGVLGSVGGVCGGGVEWR